MDPPLFSWENKGFLKDPVIVGFLGPVEVQVLRLKIFFSSTYNELKIQKKVK